MNGQKFSIRFLCGNLRSIHTFDSLRWWCFILTKMVDAILYAVWLWILSRRMNTLCKNENRFFVVAVSVLCIVIVQHNQRPEQRRENEKRNLKKNGDCSKRLTILRRCRRHHRRYYNCYCVLCSFTRFISFCSQVCHHTHSVHSSRSLVHFILFDLQKAHVEHLSVVS